MLLLLLFAKACVQIHVLFNRYKTRYVLVLLGYILLLNHYIISFIFLHRGAGTAFKSAKHISSMDTYCNNQGSIFCKRV